MLIGVCQPNSARRVARATTVVCGWAAATAMLAGCGLIPGSGSDSTTSQSPASTASSAAAPAEPTVLADGDLDLEALTDFECSEVSDGRWAAEGRVTNTSGRSARFVVMALVSGQEAATATGLREKVRTLAPGDSAGFSLQPLPAAGSENLTCQVQVVRRS